MATKPTEYLNWNPSQSNVDEPPSGQKTSGWLPAQTLPAQYQNWIENLIDQWIQWFDFISGTNFGNQITVSTTTLLTNTIRTCLADPAAASFNVMLPQSISGNKGIRYTIKNINFSSVNIVTVIPFTASGDTLEGQATVPLGAGEVITLEDNGAGAYYQVG